MIRFSISGCAIVDINSYQSEKQMMKTVDMFKDARPGQKNVEFVLNTGDRIVEASEEAFYYNGGKARRFEIGDMRWRHLTEIAKHAFVTVQQGSWYFSFSAKAGVGFWYSGDMLKVGWWHGANPEAIDHNSAMYARRDYGGN